MGEQLDLIRVSRTEMGAYLCIAQNSVPPSISKRIILNVECKSQIVYHKDKHFLMSNVPLSSLLKYPFGICL